MNPSPRRIALWLTLTPAVLYLQIVAFNAIMRVVLRAGDNSTSVLDPTGIPGELLAVLGALSLAQVGALLLPLPVEPAKGAPAPLLTRALLAGFVVACALALPVLALLDLPTFLAKPGEPLPEIGRETVHAVLTVWALSWLGFTALLTYRGGRQPDAIERAVRRATTGTAIGLALATPWYLALRRKQSCFCALGTFYALVLGIWSLIVVAGPFLLLARRERRRRFEAEGAPPV